jgi:hypothetical protein
VNREFAGEYWNHDEETWSLTKYLLEPVEQAILVSKLIGPDETYTRPGMMLFENYQGGRVGIIPFDGSTGDFDMRPVFRTWKRQRALRKMLEWINKGPLPLFVEEAPNVFPLRRDGEMAVVVGIANLTADPLPQVKFRIAVPFEGKPALELLTFSSKGPLSNFHATATDGYLRFQLPVGIAPLELACFRISAS